MLSTAKQTCIYNVDLRINKICLQNDDIYIAWQDFFGDFLIKCDIFSAENVVHICRRRENKNEKKSAENLFKLILHEIYNPTKILSSLVTFFLFE